MSQPANDSPSASPALPPGYVDREEAARISGLGMTVWKRWEAQGKVTFGQWLDVPGCGRCRVYPIDAVQQMMRDIDLTFPPPGTVDRHEAARMFGVALRTFCEWVKEGRIGCGRMVTIPGKAGQYRVYPVDELRQLVEAFKQPPPFPPPGFVTLPGAATMFGISEQTWSVWEKRGKVGAGQWFPIPGKAARCKLYRLEELQRLKAEFDRQAQEASQRLEPYADPDRPGVVRVPVQTELHPGMEALIDADDLPRVQGKRWNWSSKRGEGSNGGSVVWSGPATPLGRIILGVTDPALLVSYRNGDRLDCRRQNLIVRTRSESKKASRPPRKWAGLEPYPDPQRPGVVRVPVYSGKYKGIEALIDAADLPLVQGKRWNWSPWDVPAADGENGNGPERSERAVYGTVVLATTRERRAPLHRLIARATDSAIRVSFANGDPLDLRRQNLLTRSMTELAASSRKMATRAGRVCASRYKGVTWHADRDKWGAHIRRDGVDLFLGRFESETDAARAYDAAARALFGTNGHLNFPDEPSSPQALEEARVALESVGNRNRAQRRRQRDLERELRSAAAETTRPAQRTEADGTAVMISRETAIQLFDVTRAVWRRWRHLGWLPARVKVDRQTMYPLVEIERLLKRCGLKVLPYPDPQRPGVYRVPLAGEIARGREALIDADALPLVQTKRWWFAAAEGTQRGGEVLATSPGQTFRLHQVVMGVTGHESLIGFRSDDPLDCRRANLVLRDSTQSHAHHRKQATFCGRPCTSRFKGVCWVEKRGRWVASIMKDRVQRRLGAFRDEIAAAQAYDEAARELFGEHARLNFPDGVDVWLEAEAERLREEHATRNAVPDAAPSAQARAA